MKISDISGEVGSFILGWVATEAYGLKKGIIVGVIVVTLLAIGFIGK